MEKIDEFADERQKSWCIHCARSLADLTTNEDHVPSKAFLLKPHPHHIPKVIICEECNTSFSLDEQYAIAFLSCVLAGSTEPAQQPNASAARALGKSPALRALIEQSRIEYSTQGGQTQSVWKPDVKRIERVVLKNARGHAYFEYSEPMMGEPIHVWIFPLLNMSDTEREKFENLGGAGELELWPEVGSRMLTRVITRQDLVGSWVVVQEGIYRYSVQQVGGLRVRSALYEYLAAEVQWG